MTMENKNIFLIGDISSNGSFSIAMLVSGGVTTCSKAVCFVEKGIVKHLPESWLCFFVAKKLGFFLGGMGCLFFSVSDLEKKS